MRGCVVEEVGEKKLDSVVRIKYKKKCKRNFLYIKGLGYVNLGFLLCFERWY